MYVEILVPVSVERILSVKFTIMLLIVNAIQDIMARHLKVAKESQSLLMSLKIHAPLKETLADQTVNVEKVQMEDQSVHVCPI